MFEQMFSSFEAAAHHVRQLVAAEGEMRGWRRVARVVG